MPTMASCRTVPLLWTFLKANVEMLPIPTVEIFYFTGILSRPSQERESLSPHSSIWRTLKAVDPYLTPLASVISADNSISRWITALCVGFIGTRLNTLFSVVLLRESRCQRVRVLINLCNGGNRAIFKWLSKVITWLRLLRLVIGLKDSRQIFNQWESKQKPIAPCTRDFSRASSELHVFARNCDWFIALFASVVIGRSNCFGFGFSTVVWKPLESSNITLGLCTTTCNFAKFENHLCFPAVVGWDGTVEGKDTVAGSQTRWSQKKTWKFTYR